MTEINISAEAVARMLDGVTEGPWAVRGGANSHVFMLRIVTNRDDCVAFADGHNARFIGYARSAVPALRAALDAAEAERDAAVMRAEQAEAQLGEWKKSQHYTYIGKNGMPVLTRDLEDRLENAEARTISRIVALIKSPSVMYPNGMVDMPADELCDIISQALSDGIGGENGND